MSKQLVIRIWQFHQSILFAKVILAKVILAPEKGLKNIFRSLPNKTTQVHWTSARILRKQFIDNHYDYVGKKCWSVCQIKDNAYTEGRGDMVADGIQGYHTRHAYARIRVRNSHTASSRRERKKGEGGGGEEGRSHLRRSAYPRWNCSYFPSTMCISGFVFLRKYGPLN